MLNGGQLYPGGVFDSNKDCCCLPVSRSDFAMNVMYQTAMANNIDHLSKELLDRHYPLHLACVRGDENCVRELVRKGIDIYQEDGLRAWTPMHWAAYAGQWKCLELIKQFSGVDMDVRNTRMNQTPAHIAAQERQAECVAWLVQQGITLGIQDYMGNTPLHKAAESGSLDCVKLLTSHSELLSIFNHNGKTALNVAIDNNHQDCAVFLEQASCSQHTSFFPSASSPILMNGEGIYQRQKSQSVELAAPVNSNDQDMEMEEGAACGGGDAMNFCSPLSGVKRSFDDEEEHTFKRQRLFDPSSQDKMGTSDNNNVLSSYQGVLAMSAEPCRPPLLADVVTMQGMQQVHVMPGLAPKPCPPAPSPWPSTTLSGTASSSFLDHCNSLQAQHGYDSLVVHSLIETDHGC